MGPVGGNSRCGGIGRAGVVSGNSEKGLRELAFGRDELWGASRAVRSEEVHRKTIL